MTAVSDESENIRQHSEHRLEDFDYVLPPELIAQTPLENRSSSRLLTVNRSSGVMADRHFSDIAEFIQPGDVIVMNDSRVFPARLEGAKSTGGKVELLLVGPSDPSEMKWKVLCRPQLKEGQTIQIGPVSARCLGRNSTGYFEVEFEGLNGRQTAEKYGEMPLPPYIKRKPAESDRDRYQTVYAAAEGSIAAPTAGLHFTKELLGALTRKGVECVNVTLHVGYGTFQMVRDIEQHEMHSERFEMTEAAAKSINRALQEKKRVWAVGTTSARVLETCVQSGSVIAGTGETNLFIVPPFEFEVVGGLITNFHLPKSTLLMLVAAFVGRDRMMKAYRHAVEKSYRFYSYGDAMIIH
ncbi:MAG: tRNA preQ1(34) S-adenosylmethionine ribosyltransferase-isomerase QueA [Candidatus Omnitrophica bacterium]|jgi:S-adenosylmethionine:tRNA ribosyltransferase-isomerase|nr:tRNA preQ1(34) S-adenosylmethionine ribosyltransferase-isomerase QueA [Candidatus Omnitrophota bacterium]